MSGKEKRMAKAVRLHYMEDMSYTEIAKELGLSKSTVKKYFADDQVKQLRRYFSDQEKYELQRAVEQDLWDKEQIANECVGKAKQLADSSRAYNQTAKTAMNTIEKKVKLLQELGIIQKPKERKEVTETSEEAADVLERLQDAYNEKKEVDNNA
jgi:DNA-binding transcriptional regulator LsrR (DeoR family)